MSLKSLLAVGESFSGTGVKPYEVKKKDQQIPIFATTAEGGSLENDQAGEKGSQNLLSSTSVDNKEGADAQMNLQAREERVRLAPERRRIEKEPQERRSFLDRRWRGGPAKKLAQAEMSLEQVRVVRNDLSDSDLELAPRRAARAAQSEFNPFAPRPIAAIGRPTHEKSGMGERVARWFRFLKKPRS
jgi:hypothetical protein